jgi:hypothetical protein
MFWCADVRVVSIIFSTWVQQEFAYMLSNTCYEILGEFKLNSNWTCSWHMNTSELISNQKRVMSYAMALCRRVPWNLPWCDQFLRWNDKYLNVTGNVKVSVYSHLLMICIIEKVLAVVCTWFMCYGGLMVSGRKQLRWKTRSVNNFITNFIVCSKLSTYKWVFFWFWQIFIGNVWMVQGML